MIEVQADPAPKNLFLFRQFLSGEGDKEIGEKMNKIISKLAEANDLKALAVQVAKKHGLEFDSSLRGSNYLKLYI